METVSLNRGVAEAGLGQLGAVRAGSSSATMKLPQDTAPKVESPIRTPAMDRPAAVTNRPAVELDPQQAKSVIDQLNQTFQPLNNAIQFKMDEDAGKMVFYLKDGKTDEVIRQIPAEVLLHISKNISQYLEQVQSDLRQGNSVKLPTGLITDATA